MIEVIEKRTRSSKTHSLGGRKFAYDGTIGSIHYEDNGWQNIDNIFEPAVAPWDWEMLKAGYHIRVKEDFTAGQIIEFEVQGETVQLQPMALEWTNDLDQIQLISMPQGASPIITNPVVDLLPAVGMPSHQGTIRWPGAYGQGIDFEWKCSSTRLVKTLEIENLNNLPVPQQYILDGGNPVLRLNLIFDPSKDVDIYVDGELWDRKVKKQTFSIIEFHKDGEVLWGFMPLRYWGSNPESEDNEGQSVAILEKRGNKLYISIRVPYDWLQSAVYPVFVDTDVVEQIGASSDDASQHASIMYLELSTLSVTASNRWGGLRFTGVNIPSGNLISVAYVELYFSLIANDSPIVDVYCEDGNNPGTFTTASSNISNRARTTNKVNWTEDDLGIGWHQPDSLVALVQEVVIDNAGTGDALVFILDGLTDTNMAPRSWDYDTSLAAKLHIEHTPPLKLEGVTKDKDGNVKANCKCFLCKDNGDNTASFIAYTQSDGSGNYSFTGLADGDAQHFVISWKDETPHIFDVTDHILQPVE